MRLHELSSTWEAFDAPYGLYFGFHSPTNAAPRDLVWVSLSLPLARVIVHFYRHFAVRRRKAQRRQVEPHMRADIVLRHAVALGVHPAEVGLRVGVPLVGGLAEPYDGLRVVLRHAWPVAYTTPRSACAAAFPWSAALRYHAMACA